MSSKNKFTNIDIKTIVRDLRDKILGTRVSNVYDINDKTYLIKFNTVQNNDDDDNDNNDNKPILLIESGVRFHLTKYARDKNNFPSPFGIIIITTIITITVNSVIIIIIIKKQ